MKGKVIGDWTVNARQKIVDVYAVVLGTFREIAVSTGVSHHILPPRVDRNSKFHEFFLCPKFSIRDEQTKSRLRSHCSSTPYLAIDRIKAK